MRKKKNEEIENELLKKFKSLLRSKYGYNEDDIILAAKNASKTMDCTIINEKDKFIIGIEAKCLPDPRSDSTAFLSIFGKILKGRKLTSKIAKQKSITNCEYGLLFRAEDRSKFIDNYSKVIDKEDWDAFCDQFNVKYIYFCSEDNIENMDAKDVNKAE